MKPNYDQHILLIIFLFNLDELNLYTFLLLFDSIFKNLGTEVVFFGISCFDNPTNKFHRAWVLTFESLWEGN